MSKAVLMQGNEAAVEGAIAAGMRVFAGYPITPSTEIAEQSALRLPQVGGHFIQMEDEISSIAAVLGASAAGVKRVDLHGERLIRKAVVVRGLRRKRERHKQAQRQGQSHYALFQRRSSFLAATNQAAASALPSESSRWEHCSTAKPAARKTRRGRLCSNILELFTFCSCISVTG